MAFTGSNLPATRGPLLFGPTRKSPLTFFPYLRPSTFVGHGVVKFRRAISTLGTLVLHNMSVETIQQP
jgi:hypothetical protein